MGPKPLNRPFAARGAAGAISGHMPQKVRYRRSPHIVCYWKHGEFLFRNYATGRLAGATPLACDVLEFFSGWRPITDLFRSRPETNDRLLRQLVNGLVDATLLQRSGRRYPAEEAMSHFERWNPEAGFFHAASKNVQFADIETAEQALLEQAEVWPMPSPIKRYPRAKIEPLPVPERQGAIEAAFLARRTWRRFGNGEIPLEKFSTLLGITAGVQHWVTVDGHGEVPLKTAPSGGARHPVELYVLSWGISGLRSGLYHYAADAHVLELIDRNQGRGRVKEWFPQSGYFNDACAVVLFTAMYERDLWRYPYSRAYRAPFIEAGHLCQTFCVLAAAHDLAPFCLMGLADSVIERDLGIDGTSESVLYAAGVGILPEGVGWAPAPPGFQPPPIRANTFGTNDDAPGSARRRKADRAGAQSATHRLRRRPAPRP